MSSTQQTLVPVNRDESRGGSDPKGVDNLGLGVISTSRVYHLASSAGYRLLEFPLTYSNYDNCGLTGLNRDTSEEADGVFRL